MLIRDIHSATPNEINQAAVNSLVALTACASLNLISQITGITRVTLYKWLDEEVSLDEMDHRLAGWFLLLVNTSPKLVALLERGPAKHPRLAKRWLDSQGEDDDQE